MTDPATGAPHPRPPDREPDALLTGLTPEQALAVCHGPGPLLIVAGPGTGKTRALTHRVAHLLVSRPAHGADPAARPPRRRPAPTRVRAHPRPRVDYPVLFVPGPFDDQPLHARRLVVARDRRRVRRRRAGFPRPGEGCSDGLTNCAAMLGVANSLAGVASVGPLVPSERSLLVLVGGGYVIGDFLFTVIVGAGATRLASIRRRRVGVAVALPCLIGWIVGHASDAMAYPWLGAERSLLDVGGWFGAGPVVVAALLWLLVGRSLATSRNIDVEDTVPEITGRSFGLVLAGAYLFIWSGIQSAPRDGHQTLESISSVIW